MNKNYGLCADLSLVLVAMIWGSGFIASKYAISNSMSVGLVMTLRFTIASILLFTIFSSKIIKSDLLYFPRGLLTGLLLFLGFYAQTWGLRYITPSANAFITSTNVVIVPFLSWIIFHKRPGLFPFISSFICMIGIGILSYNQQTGFNFGLGSILTLLSALFFAGHIAYMDVNSKKMDFRSLTFIQMLTAAILSALSLLIEPKPIDRQAFNIVALSSAVYLGLFSTFCGFLIQTVAQKYTTSTRTAVILANESLFGSFFSVLLGIEMLTGNLIIGGIMIISAVIICEIRK